MLSKNTLLIVLYISIFLNVIFFVLIGNIASENNKAFDLAKKECEHLGDYKPLNYPSFKLF